jgi:hypothetical protein
MTTIFANVILLVVAGCFGPASLEKTWPTASENEAVKTKTLENQCDLKVCSYLAESEGFEPTVGGYPTTVFKTAAINRSANSPRISLSFASPPATFSASDQADFPEAASEAAS